MHYNIRKFGCGSLMSGSSRRYYPAGSERYDRSGRCNHTTIDEGMVTVLGAPSVAAKVQMPSYSEESCGSSGSVDVATVNGR